MEAKIGFKARLLIIMLKSSYQSIAVTGIGKTKKIPIVNGRSRRECIMNDDGRVFQIVANEVKEEVCGLDILTPEIFNAVYAQIAKKHNIEDDESTKEQVNKEIEKYLELQQKTTQQVDALSQNTSKAIEAIKHKDDTVLQEVQDETVKLKQELEKMKTALYHDELTNVYNRKWLFDNLVNKDHLFEGGGVMALIDLNYFKQVNDTFGHVVGDKVLVFVSAQLRKSKGIVARYGGDEFLVFFENKSDHKRVKQILVKIREDVLKKHLRSKNTEFRTSFSIGLARYGKDDKLEDILEKADGDMYNDKKEFKKRVTGIEV